MNNTQPDKGGGETPLNNSSCDRDFLPDDFSIENISDEEYERVHREAKEFNLEPDFICVPKNEKQKKNTQAPHSPESLEINPYNHFEQRASGLYHIEIDSKGEEKETWICSPLQVLGQTRDSESNAWGLLLEWRDPDNKTHRWAMPKALLVGRDASAWLSRLVDEGLRVASHAKAKQSIALFLSTVQCDDFILCVNSTGWHKDKFVFPSYIVEHDVGRVGRVGRVGLPNDNNMLARPESKNLVGRVGRHQAHSQIVLQANIAQNPYMQSGNIEEWQATIGKWAQGNSRLILAICSSLSAVLLDPTHTENGGFNFVGGSSTGKTTALCVGASVWGKGASQDGYIQSWRATDNGLEGIYCLHNDACLCLDELG